MMWPGQNRGGGTLALSATAFALALLPAPLAAQQGEKQKSVGGEAKSAVLQPLKDLNLAGDEIPTDLLLLKQAPYATDGLDSCESINRRIAKLEEILGPDVDAPGGGSGIFRTALKTGGNFLGSFIPFRSAVRQISGAKAREKKMEDAIFHGVARRSFLKGYAASEGCMTAEERAIKAARASLGME